MSGKRYTEQFKIEAVKQVTDQGHAQHGGVAENKFTGTLEVVRHELEDHYTDLAFIWLLGGIWFAI